jgi:hypothetical protein
MEGEEDQEASASSRIGAARECFWLPEFFFLLDLGSLTGSHEAPGVSGPREVLAGSFGSGEGCFDDPEDLSNFGSRTSFPSFDFEATFVPGT